MIFTPVRISQLSRDVDEKRAAFERSTEGMKKAVRRKMNPIHFIKENPQWLLGAAASVISAGSLGKMMLGFLGTSKNGHSKNGSKSGFLGGLLKFGSRTIFRTIAPMALGAARFALKSAFRSFRNRES
jgi:hypothetical protein